MAKSGTLDKSRARQLYDAGCNDAEIGRQLGCAQESVWWWRKQEGLVSRFAQRRRGSLTPSIRAMLMAGLENKAIADRLGISVDYVRAVRWRDRNRERALRLARNASQRHRDYIQTTKITG